MERSPNVRAVPSMRLRNFVALEAKYAFCLLNSSWAPGLFAHELSECYLKYPGFSFRRHLDLLSPLPAADYFPGFSRFREQLLAS